VVQEQFYLSDQAHSAGVTIVPDCGLAPGMVSILAADGFRKFTKVDSMKLRVGGLPQNPKPPLFHAISFSVEGLLNEYREESLALRDGEIVRLPALTELEYLSFPPNFPELEAFHTSGGASTLPETYAGKVKTLDYKTIRYVGHLERLKVLFDLGLADENPIEIDGAQVIPAKLLSNQLEKALPEGVADVVVAYVEVKGDDGQKATYYIEDYFDYETGHSAMQRTTAYSAGVIMQMLAEESIPHTGPIRLEESVNPTRFMELLERRHIAIDRRFA
jgi:lysine 6-dehydrogenase